MRILRQENVGYSTGIVANVNISTSNGTPVFGIQRSPQEDGVRNVSGKGIADLIMKRINGTKQDNDRTQFTKPFFYGIEDTEVAFRFEEEYERLASELKSIKLSAASWRDEFVDEVLASKGITYDDIQSHNGDVDRRVSELRKVMQASGRTTELAEDMELLKQKRNPLAKYNIVITLQIMEVFNTDSSVGIQVDVPRDAIVDTANPSVSRRYSNKQTIVICYSKEFYDSVMGILDNDFEKPVIAMDSQLSEDDFYSDISDINEIGAGSWDIPMNDGLFGEEKVNDIVIDEIVE